MAPRRLVFIAVVCVTGCGPGSPSFPELHPARGVVTNGKQPLVGATVQFAPVSANPSFSISGTTDAEGKFELSTLSVDRGVKKTGAPAGTYEVIVIPPLAQANVPAGKLAKRYTVKEGDNNIVIDLSKAKPPMPKEEPKEEQRE